MNQDLLQTPITFLKGVGPNRATLLRSELQLETYQDLLNLFPNRYIDRTRYYKINELQRNTADVQLIGQITHIKTVGQQRGKRLVATFTDETGIMELVWFRGHKWIAEQLKTGVPYVIFGRCNWINNIFSMPHPEMELHSAHEQSLRTAMQPVYPSTEKLAGKSITNRVIGKLVQQLFIETGGHFAETLPPSFHSELKLISKSEALFNIHFPKSQEWLAKAQYRLKFEELFYIQLQLISKNMHRKQKIKGFPFEKVGSLFHDFYHTHLPFQLTQAQKRVLKEIRNDLGSRAQMNRLLQGDVGSGKTIVALMSMLLAIDNGYQACLMAPTEVLANQHYNSIYQFVKDLNISIKLLTGATKSSERKAVYEATADGSLHILVGTHAVLEDKVQFKNLGLAVIDEQHKFGVAQRSRLWHKNKTPPHILVMTATPIPRTLAMSLYGDLDISVIDELPPGRIPIKTVHHYDSRRLNVFRFLKDEIAKGRQVYIVYPLIRESEKMDYKDLMDGYTAITRDFPKPQYQISIVHGQMKATDKAFEMERFTRGKTQIMVATTVIEVGVDVANATVMVIESAERFGLSQLHQLRGRVGRGVAQSHCILMTGFKLSEEARTRLKTMCSTNDGFKIAEADLKLRGPGDLLGTQQSGILNLRIADLARDANILTIARHTAFKVLKKDPGLALPEHESIKRTYNAIVKHKNIWNYIS
ncbi:MAG: ATP-dependent DNA helicase RecG [Bacteroidota bacterium]